MTDHYSISREQNFKFYFIKNQKQTSIFSLKGMTGEKSLTLNKENIPYENVFYSKRRDRRIVLMLEPAWPPPEKIASSLSAPALLIIEVSGIKPEELVIHINRNASEAQAKKAKERLTREGKEHLFRSEKCPKCSSVIELSATEKTGYIYCIYCETIFTPSGSIITDGASHHRCEQCNMFAKIKVYTEFYFYFLLVVYGFSMRKVYLCSNCASSLFKKVLLWNFIFILGVPSAIWMKIKSLTGRDENEAELDRANYLAGKGRLTEAEAIYSKLYTHYGEHPGIIMNEGMANFAAGNQDKAKECFKRALKSCSNYTPVMALISGIGAAIGMTGEDHNREK